MRIKARSDYRELQQFLDSAFDGDDRVGFAEAQGIVFTVACAPDLVQPSEWLPLVLGERGPGFRDVEHANRVLGELMALYNECNKAAISRSLPPMHGCEFRDPIDANFATDAPISRWARGFVKVHTWLEESWNDLLPDEIAEEFGSTCMVLSFFATRELAEAYWRECSGPGVPFDEMARTMRDLFPDAAREYANMGRTIYEVISRREEAEPSRRAGEKPGRNEPCPCGSGRKYKRCHGAPDPGDRA